jgi:hypothetical protein
MSLAAVAEQLYQYSDLSDEAKRRAREEMSEAEGRDWEPEYESYVTAAALLGIDLTERKTRRGGKNEMVVYDSNTISFSGFWSQGDGASFSGSYKYVPACFQKVREDFPQDTELHSIADRLTALNARLRLLHGCWLEGTITRNDTRYSHKFTMDAVVTDSEGEEFSWDDPITKDFLELMRDFADWIYKGLEADYDWRTSDEVIEESLSNGDYEFDEEGIMQ